MIESREVAVLFHQVRGQEEGLLYTLARQTGQPANLPVSKPVDSNALKQRIEDFRKKVDHLIRTAEVGGKRSGAGLEKEADRLSLAVLPEGGLLALLGSDNHPQINTFLDIAADIPWEGLAENCLICQNQHRRTVPREYDPGDVYICKSVVMQNGEASKCSLQMSLSKRRLIDDYHLTHVVYNGVKAGAGGNRFVFVEDPMGDLTNSPIDRNGVCAGHFEKLRGLIELYGFETVVRRRENATGRAMRDLISDPSVAGIYYFGHGGFTDSGESCLYMADGELTASEIEDAKPQTRFVFLNACYAGAGAGNANAFGRRRPRSVAQAFANGSGKVVIAPVFPVLNTHAAAAAVDFFRFFEKQSGGVLADALRSVRQRSWKAYTEDDEPNICWFAYRYFGDPDTRLVVAEVAAPVQASRVFDAGGRLSRAIFSFDIAEVLSQAVARRDKQERTCLTRTDLLAGLIRKGDLTRFILRQEGKDLDTLANALDQRSETEPASAQSSRSGAGQAETRADFSDSLVAILEKTAGKKNEGVQISEQDILETLVDGGGWALVDDLLLPPASRVQSRLRTPKDVDDNGLVLLSGLDATARNIIESAHRLAQQRGWQDIPNRLLLAALIVVPGGFGYRVCQCAGVDPELLCSFMIALTEGDGSDGTPRTFGLSPEVCGRVVTPVLVRARRICGEGLLGERHLFRAFCEVTSAGFKEGLRETSVEMNTEDLEMGKVDLDNMALIDPDFWEKELDGLDKGAAKVIREALDLSQDCGVTPVPNRLVLAGFLARKDWLIPTLLRRKKISAETLKAQLIAACDTGSPRKFPFNTETCQRAIRPTIQKAREIGGGQPVTAGLLFQGFCAVIPGDLKQFLRAPAFGLDLDTLARECAEPLPPAGDDGSDQSSDESSGESGSVPPDWDPHPFRADQFEENAWRVLGESARLAKQDGWDQIRSPHLLAAVLGSDSEAVGKMLRDAGTNAPSLQRLVFGMLQGLAKGNVTSPLRFGGHAAQLISVAVQMAGQHGRAQVTIDDLFVSLCLEQNGPAAALIRNIGVGLAFAGPAAADFQSPKRLAALATFGVDLTERARQGQLPRIVGREDETDTAMQTLQLLENASPLLVGEAGVGKTAIVEGIAQRIVDGTCPKKLSGMRVIELSAGSLVANTRLRGEFEQRIQEVLVEARGNVILFIDEIHNLVGAGSAEGSGPDAGNMLKTALSKGEIRLIGATTHAEFKRTIGRDRALSRRFQVQTIGPPSREATLQVLAARRAVLEKHHEVKISEEAEAAAVDLSGRYIVDKQWPAKARDVIERACVTASMESQVAQSTSPPEVTREHVAKVVSRWVGVPLERLTADDWQSLSTLEDRLKSRIVGQDGAIRVVAEAIRRGRQGLSGRNRPWGVFLFVGPPGVGKTELSKVIGEEVFGGADGLIRFDMGDFTDPHSTARLIGAPPGYVGYQEGAPLVERLRTHPYSLLLFDEIEHAHENVLAVLLRLLSEGTLADADGNVADGRNCIVVFTSNLLGRGEEGGKLGFAGGSPTRGQADLRSLLERKLPRKLIDRMDGIVRFNPLTDEEMTELVCRDVEDRRAQLEVARGISVEVAPEVVAWLAERVSEAGQGARAVRRAVDDHVGGAMAAGLFNRPPGASLMIIRVSDDGHAIVAQWFARQ